MAYYKGIFVSFDTFTTYYVGCGIVAGGELDINDGTVNNADAILWRHGKRVFITTETYSISFNVEDE